MNAFMVNGQAQPLLPHLPPSGVATGPEKHWFNRLELDISGYGNVCAGNISTAMQQMALASQTRFVGKPFE